jgi:hypothetical protein
VKGSETASAPGDESEAVSESDSQWRRRFEAPESGGERRSSVAERMIEANGVELCTEAFGDPADWDVVVEAILEHT